MAGLTGQELHVLADGGYEPVSLVMGVCVYHVARQGPRSWVRHLTRTGELGATTAALFEARELAVRRLQHQAVASGGRGAVGVVGVTISQGSHVWGPRAIEFFCTGTTIRQCGGTRFGRPTTAVSVRDARTAADPAALRGRVPQGEGGAR